MPYYKQKIEPVQSGGSSLFESFAQNMYFADSQENVVTCWILKPNKTIQVEVQVHLVGHLRKAQGHTQTGSIKVWT